MEAQRKQAPSMGSCPACGAPLAEEAARMPGPHEWRCEWCEAINSLGAKRCAACGAVYPRADQDAAIQRAAEARIQSALDEIEIRERIRPKSFWKRLFG